MSDGKKLLRVVVENGSIDYLRKLSDGLFLDDEKPIYSYVRNHFRRYGELPSLATIERDGGYRLPRADENVAYYYKRVVDRSLYGVLRDQFGALRTALTQMDMDTARSIVLQMRSSTREIAPDDDIRNLMEASHQVLAAYDEAHERPGMAGIPSGWEQFDDMLGGYQKGDLVTFVARMGVGKTYILLSQALHAWRMGYSVLVVSMEMTIEQITRRVIGIEARINPEFIRKGALSPFAMNRLSRCIDNLRHADRFNIYSGSFSKHTEDIETLIHELSPDIVFIDGAYLLKPSGVGKRSMTRMEKVPEVFDELKRITITHDRPLVVTTQFSRQAGKRGKDGSMETIGFTDAIGTHSSIVVAVKEGVPPHQTTRRRLEVMKGREGEEGEFSINYRFDPVDFSELPTEQVTSESSNVDWMG